MSRNPPEKPGKLLTEAERRQAKLADALRANLRRRKAAGKAEPPNTSGKPDAGED